jgi:hypothetical protein
VYGLRDQGLEGGDIVRMSTDVVVARFPLLSQEYVEVSPGEAAIPLLMVVPFVEYVREKQIAQRCR